MKKGKVLIIIGLLLIAAALSITVYNLADTARAKKTAEKALEEVLVNINANPIPKDGRLNGGNMEYPDYVLNPNMDMPVTMVDGVFYVGTISIPSLKLDLPVCDEWDYTRLNIAPCRYTGTAYKKNMVLCAHNYDTHFGRIRDLSYGDTVIFTDMDGNVFNYKVMEIMNLEPTAVEEMTSGEWDLTLFTCTLSGVARVTVRCELIN